MQLNQDTVRSSPQRARSVAQCVIVFVASTALFFWFLFFTFRQGFFFSWQLESYEDLRFSILWVIALIFTFSGVPSLQKQTGENTRVGFMVGVCTLTAASVLFFGFNLSYASPLAATFSWIAALGIAVGFCSLFFLWCESLLFVKNTARTTIFAVLGQICAAFLFQLMQNIPLEIPVWFLAITPFVILGAFFLLKRTGKPFVAREKPFSKAYVYDAATSAIQMILLTICLALLTGDLLFWPGQQAVVVQEMSPLYATCFFLLLVLSIYNAHNLKRPFRLIYLPSIGIWLLVSLVYFSFFAEPIPATLASQPWTIMLAFAAILIGYLARIANPYKKQQANPSGDSQEFQTPHHAEVMRFCSHLAQENGLTKREEEVLCLLAQGRSTRSIQQKLFLAEGTVRTHVSHIYQKMGLHNKQDLLDLLDRTMNQ
ncbi:MAG: helix-turn-helix transcriptional regulator [Raoultibacter sp.]